VCGTGVSRYIPWFYISTGMCFLPRNKL